MLGQLKRISYNLRAELDTFVEEFVKNDGIKEIMYMIEECQDLKEYDMIYVAGQMMSVIFQYGCGIEYISKQPRKYFEKFLELSSIRMDIKKQAIRIFYNVSQNMSGCFDKIEKAATNYARETSTKMYSTLLKGLESQDPVIAIAFLKFINQMIYKADDEAKKAKFIARLDL